MKNKLKKLQLGKLFKTKKGIILVGIFLVVLLAIGIGFSYAYYYKDDVDVIINGNTLLRQNDIEINIYIQKRNSSGDAISGYDKVYFLPEYGYTLSSTTCTNGITYNGITNGKVNVTATKRGKCDLYYSANSVDSIQENPDGMFNLYIEQTDGLADYLSAGEVPDDGKNYIVNTTRTTSSCNKTYINQYGELIIKTNAKISCDIYLDIEDWRSEYQQVEYIENTSTSYIATGISASEYPNNFKYEISFGYNAFPTAGTTYVLGSRAGTALSNSRSGNIHLSKTGGIYVNINNSSQTATSLGPGTSLLNAPNYITFEVKKSPNNNYVSQAKFNLNGIEYSQNGEFYSQTTTNFTLFNLNNEYPFLGKIYYFRLYDGYGNLIRNFIPVYRKSDNVIGVYDLVTGTFKANSGSGTFSKGPDVNTHWQNIYQKVEYLESHGTEYITTNIIPTNTMGSCIKMISYQTNADNTYFGSLSSSPVSRWYMGNIQGKVYYSWNTNLATNLRPEISDGMYFEACQNQFNDRTRNFNGVSYPEIGTTVLGTTSYPISIFAVNKDGDLDYNLSQMRLYSFVITDNTSISSSFVPVVRKSDGKPGLYDEINNVFYTNAGTGEFTYGRAIKK